MDTKLKDNDHPKTDNTATENVFTETIFTENKSTEDVKEKAGRKKNRAKNNKSNKGGILAAVLFVFLAAAGFVSLYPHFQMQVDFIRDEFNEDAMENEDFLRDLYKANTILYKELQEQILGTPLRYQDVYLSITEEPVSNTSAAYIDFGGESAGEYAGRKIYEMLRGWEDDFENQINYIMDYQIIDHEKDTMVTNTGSNLCQLGTKEASAELLSRYPYYIKMRYDDAGFLEHVWVKGSDGDSLLRNVQRVMRSSYLERSFYDFYYADGYLQNSVSEGDIYYYYDSSLMKAQIAVNNTPRNCTICYAFTTEQKSFLTDCGIYTPRISSYGAYSSIGIANVFRIFLIILGVLALMLPLSKRYHLHEVWVFQFHLEILCLILFVLFVFMGEIVTELVMYTMDSWDAYSLSDLGDMIQSCLPNLSVQYIEAITVGFNVVCLFLMFGLWYILVTGLGQVHTLGCKRYFKERSICYRIWHGANSYGSRKVTAFKEEILHVDLGANINKTLFKIVVLNYLVLAFLSMLWFAGVFLLLLYSVVLYLALKKYIRHIQMQYKNLLKATQSIADGNLQTKFTGDWGVFESYKNNLAEIQLGFSKAVEEEVKSQRMRTELITNVSHDLKTPLTAITTYIELLQEEGVTKEQREEYLDVLARKARRLKTLIEDLFEISKASSGNVVFQLEKVDIGNLMRQVYLEYEDKVEEAGLIFRFRMPEDKQFLMLDSQKTYRIFENLYTNIIKYAMPHTRVYVSLARHDDTVVIELKNMSGTELTVSPDSLMERFVRGDSSRNTEGSGLGLAIARSFVELQKGKMKVTVDGDLFKVTIVWKGL